MLLNEIKLKVLRATLRYYHELSSRGKVKIDNLVLFIEKGIFNPKRTFSSTALLNFLKSKDIRSTLKAVDVGTGTGIIAAFLCSTKKLRRVVASDISFQTVKTSQRNFKENEVYDYIDVIACDTLSPFRDSAFDLVISNPPYLPLKPKDSLDRLFCAGEKLETLAKIIEQSRHCLKLHGTLIFTISSLTPIHRVSELLINNGFIYIRHRIARTLFDKIYVIDATLISKMN